MVKSFARAIRQKLIRARLKRRGVIVRTPVLLGRVDFDGDALVEPYCRLVGDPLITIGRNFYMNAGCHLLGEITIGNDVQIGPKVVIWGRDHGMVPGTPMRLQQHVRSPVVIGNDVWIGANVTVLKGVTIGDGAVVGAGAVVTKDLAPMVMAGGNPARVIRFRGDIPSVSTREE